MTLAEYLCPECGSRTETETRADRLDRCRNEGCYGVPRRIWNGSFIRSNIRAVAKG